MFKKKTWRDIFLSTTECSESDFCYSLSDIYISIIPTTCLVQILVVSHLKYLKRFFWWCPASCFSPPHPFSASPTETLSAIVKVIIGYSTCLISHYPSGFIFLLQTFISPHYGINLVSAYMIMVFMGIWAFFVAGGSYRNLKLCLLCQDEDFLLFNQRSR